MKRYGKKRQVVLKNLTSIIVTFFRNTFFHCVAVTIGALVLSNPLFGASGVDTRGVTVRLSEEKVRVVSLSPGATEILYEFGLRSEIVGVSDFCDYPLDFVATKPKMGGFSTPNLEQIQAVTPDVVLLATVVPIQLKNQFERLGIEVFVTSPASFNELLFMIDQLGKLFDRRKEAQLLVKEMKNEAGRISDSIKAKSLRPVKTFIEIHYNPFYAAGRDTLPGDLVVLAGGEVVPHSGTEYPRIDEESLLALDPEAIILGHSSDDEIFRRSHTNLKGIQAIRNNKILMPDPNEFLRPGPRVINALKEIAQFLHPEAF
jgi:iron complex transport system substrate-binding protein